MVRRHAILAALALLGGLGCHAGTPSSPRQAEAPPTIEAVSKARFVAQHNKNAKVIQSLQAKPTIVAYSGGRDFHVKGYMALERPKDFRLEIASTLNKQADIGSNEQGFWFWVKDNKEPAIYVCDYEQVKDSPLTAAMQPDWIVESLGLREISEREAATMVAKTGDKPGTLLLTQLRTDPRGNSLAKETVVDEASGLIKEHRLYAVSGQRKELIAKATIGRHQNYELGATGDGAAKTVVTLPSQVRLDWVMEKFGLDVTMNQTRINPRFSVQDAEEFFTEPVIAGVVRTNLAQVGNGNAPAGRPNARANGSTIYESMPRAGGIRLGQPETLPGGNDGASRDMGDASTSAASGPPGLPDLASTGVVTAPIPRATDPAAVQAANGRGWARPTFEQ